VLENRPEPYKSSDVSPKLRWGSYHCGINLIPLVCPNHQLILEVEHQWKELDKIRRPSTDSSIKKFTTGRVPPTVLQMYPIDILIADHSSDRNMDQMFGSDNSKIPEWMEWVRRCPAETRPRVIVQVWPSWSLTSDPGPSTKFPRKTLDGCGYDLRYRVINASDHGSPVKQHRLVIIGFKRDSESQTDWDRSMSNCLRPFGFGPTRDSLPQGYKATTGKVPDSDTDPMPCKVNSWIHTPTGYRRLFNDELAKGLGASDRISTNPSHLHAALQ
jgi:hypothetical protein